MNKRRAARELALIAFSQLSKNISKSDDINIYEIIEKSALSLTSEAENNINSAVEELIKIREFMQTYEDEHPENLEKPYDIETIPVIIPLTSDMLGRIDMLLEAAEKSYSAIDLTKLVVRSNLDEVKDYAVKIVKTFIDNKDKTDAQIKKHSRGWDIERLVKIDRNILRIAITEILFFEDVDVKISANEAVELAKKYSCNESSKFINGILGQVIRGIMP